MPETNAHYSKSKITVTLSPDLVQKLDALLDSKKNRSRSQLMERALREWLHEQAAMELNRQTEEYYRNLSSVEREEDKKWSKIAAHSAKRFWDK
jgi:metal-responsive CopG/Arc/MetJ family transcriptional regulator